MQILSPNNPVDMVIQKPRGKGRNIDCQDIYSHSNIYWAADIFDAKYITQISRFLQDKNPLGAYDHIKNSGLSDPSAIIYGYTLIYSWLWKDSTITDIEEMRENFLGKIMNLLKNLSGNAQNKEHQKLLSQLEQEIQIWYKGKISLAYMESRSIGAPFSLSLKIFPEKVPKESPLGRLLKNILHNNAE